ncbi:MAG: transketolase [Actinomycetota bacterium]|nr:transketolase [Actinomycetota bacterium]
MDAPLHANSGHQGTAMALAPLAHVMFSRVMRLDPADTRWPDHDRFVLSNGHASILQYTMLYLTGSGLEMPDLQAFRSFESRTPGHPEARHTPGVDVTTGPLGQGFANSVGMAVAERVLRDEFGEELVNHFTFVIAGDGCFMEGISHEAASLAGHLGLGRLICVYDDNRITIDGVTDLALSDDVAGRFRAYGWDVVELGEAADELDTLEQALLDAKDVTDRPSLLVLRSHVAYPSPDHTDNYKAHGNPFTPDDVTRTKEVMGIPDEPFWAPEALVAAYRRHATTRGAECHGAWDERLAAADPAVRERWDAAWGSEVGVPGWTDALPAVEIDSEPVATRVAINDAINATLDHLPGLIAGSADLTGNTGTKLSDATQQTGKDPGGRQLYFGVREHAMGASMVGMALHGGVLPVGGTFFVFADYMRPSIRLAAVSKAKVVFVFSHDSVGVGEDGPTHQPVEQLASLRAMPDLHVIRPADANETTQAWRVAVEREGPTALILSRQDLPVCTDGSAVARGAGVVRDCDGDAELVLVGTGSEVSVCLAAAEKLEDHEIATRVVSLPSWDRFEQQDEAFFDEMFPEGVPVLSVEAGTTFGWERYADDSIGIDRFGVSAPGAEVLDRLGINPDHVAARARQLLADSQAQGAN